MDRTFRGAIAGIIGGIIMDVWDLISYHFLQIGSFRYLDWAAMMIYGEPPENIYETIVSLITQVLWAGFLGIIFSFILIKITSRGYLIKGALYGFIASFIIFAIPVLFKVPHLDQTGPNTQISHFIGAIIYGVTTAAVLHWLDSTPGVKNKS
ncbi:hypothetical protein SAMN05660649_02393 [Desulfotomaculum arcticum]|uniref:Uncharacterized protein n=2 Tax=Desulfotruncus TaxID=2867377 RepID=A0A1I2TXH4_9FIRM|nr:hypothetical protein SAMN05660649_02393 [Desulfotomaculum arcticum] [Desulfotruncus arcticus DSM 17038]